ncbi:MAG TPA: c-type cytochrome [Gammaproteobacteria bacterium]|nr:c-type cytochrome [Gammaproteobacteria bacterium]
MILLIISARIITKGVETPDTTKDPMVQAAIEKRIKPFGAVNVGEPGKGGNAGQAQAAASGGSSLSGKQIVDQTCAACHGSGVMGAPKIGNKGDWEPRIKKGVATLLKHAENGFNKMPARGGKPSLTNEDLKHAIAYMLSKVGVKDAFAGESKGGSQGGSASASASKSESKPAATGGSADLAKGKEVVAGTCAACHGTGVLGAPKIGNKADWAPRIKKGLATLEKHALHGYKAMPAKGGKASLSDQEVKDAIEYMISQSK